MPVDLGENPRMRKPVEPEPSSDIAPAEITWAAERFLFREARLLDEERYEEWLGTLTSDIRYWMPGIQARYRDDVKARVLRNRAAFYDEDMLALRRRVTRALDATAWAEDPPTRTVHIITNVEAELTDDPSELRVYSAFTTCRGRNETDEDTLSGRRKDVLRYVDGVLKLASREIFVTQAVLKAKNLNIFL
ncbi:3-phenylpropionate/cinnamic acid dioxygenase subunit beta [Paraburkholderia caribensis]|uniref:3-phenylpropionate/cinnamic acid dioxygenase subunit beta n=1 Tax=Paraburkholderia caribensis TaxID=75105 RepID=UPI001CB3710E|nr:3-phenylpropionate/cinnamic acid dioxygenase subunit beta [Paraburkholderia caribensis]CAG9263005.1 putative Biphenyl dioxygenase subunit beta [Paraburkholderia caribensis]